MSAASPATSELDRQPSSSRPVIGITPGLERARWSVWDQEALLVPRLYCDAVRRAGGLALVVVPDERLERDPDELLDLLDGVLLTGGSDVDPRFYGAARHAQTSDTVPQRDAFELALVRRALARDLPVLGICRGMQLFNVARGGTLRQHLPDSLGHHEHRRSVGSFDDADHDVALEPDSLAARVVGELRHATKSHHHQGVERIGPGLRVTGHCVLDDLPEALEDPSRRFALGVQWHPEADETSPVIAAFVTAALEGRRARLELAA